MVLCKCFLLMGLESFLLVDMIGRQVVWVEEIARVMRCDEMKV